MGIDLFVCGDQRRKGAALNAVQIAEMLVGTGNGQTPSTEDVHETGSSQTINPEAPSRSPLEC